MSTDRPRRPAQLLPEQIDLIADKTDIVYDLELAHLCAQAVVPLANRYEADEQVRMRIVKTITEQGIDVIADAWVDAPDNSLPGILWRGFLLHLWIKRYPQVVQERINVAKAFYAVQGEDLKLVVTPQELLASWEQVFRGNFSGNFLRILQLSAEFTNFLGRVVPDWIEDKFDPLATEVTLRDVAMKRTAREFYIASELLANNNLE